MRKILRLQMEANETATFLGHHLKWFRVDVARKTGDCRDCGLGVTVDAQPMPNGINIGGPAVALNCHDKEGTA